MKYDFSSLSHNDFEDLSRDLLGRELGVRFEAFPEGPDDGIDGRHCVGEGTIILQAKHYHRSGFSALKSKIGRERAAIDRLQPKRYLLTTSTPLTPKNKRTLSGIIGPALLSEGDLFGPDDLNVLLRKYPDIEKSHQRLWAQSTTVLEEVVSGAVKQAMARPSEVPSVLANLLSPRGPAEEGTEIVERDVIYVIKSSPIDDEFVLWLAPKLEAEGYRVFADILTLQPGDRWRRETNAVLQARTAKALLLSKDATLVDQHVQDDLDIALETGKELGDTRFIIPLRLEPGRKTKGIGDAVPVDFVRGWGEGLTTLVDALSRQKVPRSSEATTIDPNWEVFRRRGAVPLVKESERLISNWLRVIEAPDVVRFYEASGVIDRRMLQAAIEAYPYPSALQGAGIIVFAAQAEVDEAFKSAGRFKLKREIPLLDFVGNGMPEIDIERQVASNLVIAMLKKAWYAYCKQCGFLEYQYSNGTGFHASVEQAPTGQRIPWGKQGERRSSMLRNVAKGHIWQFGVTGMPFFWPFWHFKLKSRVLFSTDNGTATGIDIDDPKKLHRLRRSLCKGWRNKQWYGRMLAFLELLSGESAYIRLPMSSDNAIVLEAAPVLFSSPVSTALPDILDADEEETDLSTLGRPTNDDEEGAA
jgi:hypothetical protein